ncbi:MAG: hypothetical protein K2X32_03785 [Phycisphaerales bacterium]|nr:hypothetical protein [Phycisphaerales bacterium]
MSIPYQDWQFWATTLLALVAGGYLLRNILPVPFFSRRARARRQEKPATLTVSAKKHE